MEHTPHRVIADRVRELRTRRGWSAERLAQEMTAVGVPWERMVVTKLETGRRQAVSVEELLALAYVLNVAPVHLVVPIRDVPYRLLPQPLSEDENHIADAQPEASRVREWFVGREPLSGTDIRTYYSEVPEEEFRQRTRVVESIHHKLDRHARGLPTTAGLNEPEPPEDGGDGER